MNCIFKKLTKPATLHRRPHQIEEEEKLDRSTSFGVQFIIVLSINISHPYPLNLLVPLLPQHAPKILYWVRMPDSVDRRENYHQRLSETWFNSAAYIQKAGFAGSQKPQMILNFPQTDCLRTRKLSIWQCVLEVKVKRHLWKPKCNEKSCRKSSINTCVCQVHSDKMLLKDSCPFFCKKSLNLNDLRTCVANFCRDDLRTFPAHFFGLKRRIRKLFRLLDVCALQDLFS